jgi:predicted N-acyltransferase
MPEVRVVETLADVDRDAWSALFPGDLEDYDYLTAVERSGLDGFCWRYVLVSEGGDLVAAAPGFITDYPLETTLGGPGRRIADAVLRAFPRLLTLRLGCIGSPCAERAQIGVAPQVSPGRRADYVRTLVDGFERAARREGCSLIGLKDVAEADRPAWAASLEALGYRAVDSMPVAHLPVDFADLDEYCARLSPATRKDMRRKLRVLDDVRIETRTEIDDVIDRVMGLYADTRGRAKAGLEVLTADYFRGVLRRMPGRALMVLYYAGPRLLAANLLLRDGDTLLDKYFCMDAAEGRSLNLYFISWFTNLRLCLEAGQTRYQAGQAAYGAKLRLGARLSGATNFFRHRNPLVNAALRFAAPLFAFDPVEGAAS